MRLAVTTLIAMVAALTTLGFLALYSAGMQSNGMQFVTMQAVWAVAAITFGFAASRIDYRIWRKLAPWLAVVAVILLALVLIPTIGVKKNGARRWFDLGFMHFQPSELAKIAMILLLALVMERWQRYRATWWRGCWAPCLLAGTIILLVYKEPDRGTAILLSVVAFSIFLLGGMRWRSMALVGSLAAAYLAFSLANDPMRLARIMSWAQPEMHRNGPGYQAWQASIALGAGGATGVGLGNGRQKLGFVPEHHTDFIFSVVGEELGLAATLGVTVAYVLIALSGFYIAHGARDKFGALVGGGITTLITVQALINIGVVTGSIPNKGLPLPFMSYGGSNLMLMFSCVGMLVSIARVATEVEQVARNREVTLELEEATA